MTIINFLLTCGYFVLPIAVANLTPSLCKNMFKRYAHPIDFGIKLRGKPLLGKNKTIKGLLLGVVASIIVVYIQKLLSIYPAFQSVSYLDYSNFVLIGFLLGFGALFGDLVESLIKRQCNVAPGKPFIPWDQLDFIIGAMIFISFVKPLTWQMSLFFLIIVPFFHIGFNHAGYYLGLQKNKF